MALDGELDGLVLGVGRSHGRAWPLLGALAIVDEAWGGFYKDGRLGVARRQGKH